MIFKKSRARDNGCYTVYIEYVREFVRNFVHVLNWDYVKFFELFD